MRFSLIISTRGRRDEIGAFFDSLLRQELARECEVLLVDQNGDDRLVELVARYAGQLSIKHVRTEVRGGSRGRNVGLRHATGEIIGFPDDDCEYTAGYLAHVDELFRQHPDLDGITSHQSAERNPADRPQWRAGAEALDRRTVLNRSQEFTIVVRRGSLGSIRFNDRLGVGSGTPWGADEGPDLLIRLMDAGNRLVYYPNLLIYHPNKVARVSRAALARAASYSRGRGALFRLHRLPTAVVMRAMVRPALGSALYLVALRPLRSAYYLAIATGILRGLLMTRAEAVELAGPPAPGAAPLDPAPGGIHVNG